MQISLEPVRQVILDRMVAKERDGAGLHANLRRSRVTQIVPTNACLYVHINQECGITRGASLSGKWIISGISRYFLSLDKTMIREGRRCTH